MFPQKIVSIPRDRQITLDRRARRRRRRQQHPVIEATAAGDDVSTAVVARASVNGRMRTLRIGHSADAQPLRKPCAIEWAPVRKSTALAATIAARRDRGR
ncbi:MAG TPA: hypothetical protein VGF99_19335 [Myxococcota bacterium]